MRAAVLCLIAALAVAAAAPLLADAEYAQLFSAWRRQHGKTYGACARAGV